MAEPSGQAGFSTRSRWRTVLFSNRVIASTIRRPAKTGAAASWRAGKSVIFEAFFSRLSHRSRARVYATIATSLITTITGVIAPFWLARLVDEIAGGAQGSSPFVDLLLYVGTFGLSRMLSEQLWFIYQPAEVELLNAIRRLYLSKIVSLPLQAQEGSSIGRMNAVVAQGMSGIQSLFSTTINQAIPLLFQVIATLMSVGILVSPVSAVIIVTMVCCYALLLASGAERVSRNYRKAIDSSIDTQALVGDVILNAEGIKALAIEPVLIAKYDALLTRSLLSFRNYYRARGLLGVGLGLITVTGFGLIMFMVLPSVLKGEAPLGTLVLVSTYLAQIVRPVESFGMFYREGRQAVTAVARFAEIFAMEPEPRLAARTLPAAVELVAFENISFSYEGRSQVLQSFSLEVRRAETVALLGESGSGKSTLIRLMLKLYEPSSGEIRIDDVPLTEIDTNDLRRHCAIVPQDLAMFRDSLAFNVALAEHPDEDRLWHALRSAQLDEFVQRLPKGLETMVGERGLQLSGGERQRLAIARALYRQPKILLLDEATSALDPITRDEVLATLRDIVKHYVTLIVTHDPAVAAIAKRVVTISPSAEGC